MSISATFDASSSFMVAGVVFGAVVTGALLTPPLLTGAVSSHAVTATAHTSARPAAIVFLIAFI